MTVPPYFDHPRCLKLLESLPWDECSCVRWSPDSRFLASCGNECYRRDAVIFLWNAATGTLLMTLTPKLGAISALAWSPDSQLLAYTTEKGPIGIWNPQTNTIVSTFYTPLASSLQWSDDGATLLSCGKDGVLLWNARTGKIVQRFLSASGEEQLVGALHPQSTHIALGAKGGQIRVLDLLTGACVITLIDHLQTTPCLRWSRTGDQLLYSHEETILRVWTVSSGKKSGFFTTPGGITDACWSADESKITAVTMDLPSPTRNAAFCIWERQTTEILHHFPVRRAGSLLSIDFAPDGTCLALAGYNGTLQVWDLDGTHYPQLWANDPPRARREELRFAYERNRELGQPPYAGVTISSRQEVEWIIQEHDWFSRNVEKGGTPAHPDSAQFALADLRGVDLSCLEFNTANFSGADLRGANLTSCDFLGADLDDAQFVGANLQKADLSYASLQNNDFSGANLSSARLFSVWIYLSTFRGCNMQKAMMNASTLIDSDLTEADLSDAAFSVVMKECILVGAHFTDTDISYAQIEQCLVDHADVFACAKRNESTRIKELLYPSQPPGEQERA
jgi:uncharacterized protein YjbI with pentapeptide repeats